MTHIVRYITTRVLLEDKNKTSRITRKYCSYSLIEGLLYLHGFINLILKCMMKKVGRKVSEEIPEAFIGCHLVGKALAKENPHN